MDHDTSLCRALMSTEGAPSIRKRNKKGIRDSQEKVTKVSRPSSSPQDSTEAGSPSPRQGTENNPVASKRSTLRWEPFVHFSDRPVDLLLVAYFFFSFLSTYFFAIQQASGVDFDFPRGVIYPSPFLVDLFVWWGRTYQPLCLINPLFFRVIQIMNCVVFGPYFLFGVVTFLRGLNWIRIPTLIWSVCNLQALVLIMSEDFFGVYATPNPSFVLYVYYAFHLLFSIFALYRAWSPFPFGGYIRLVRPQ